jgi:phage RecT family recombinase
MSTTAIEIPKLTPDAPPCVVEVRDRMTHILKVLPHDVDPQRFANVTIMALMRTPMLHKCNATSIVEAAYKIARLGLELGLTAHILPFKGTAQLVIQYNGLMQLARPYIRSAHACVVYSNEPFLLGPGRVVLEHEPILDESQRGKPIAAYCRIEHLNGGIEWTVMSLDEVSRIERAVKARANGRQSPWDSNWSRMVEKTVLRRALTWGVPMPPGIVEVLRDVDRAENDTVRRAQPAPIVLDNDNEPIEAEFEGDARD